MMDGQRLFIQELQSLSKEFPGFSIRPKEHSVLCRLLSVLAEIFTLGRSEFMICHTLVGKTLYTGSSWDGDLWAKRWIVLRHTRVHLRQVFRLGLGYFFRLGWLVWVICYFLLPLPAGWTLRAHWERAAWAETIHAYSVLNWSFDLKQLIDRFTTIRYFWMWPFRKRVRAWALGVIAREDVKRAL